MHRTGQMPLQARPPPQSLHRSCHAHCTCATWELGVYHVREGCWECWCQRDDEGVWEP